MKARPSEPSFLNKEGDEITGEAIREMDTMVDKVWRMGRISNVITRNR